LKAPSRQSQHGLPVIGGVPDPRTEQSIGSRLADDFVDDNGPVLRVEYRQVLALIDA
jgi:hypothetical protein